MYLTPSSKTAHRIDALVAERGYRPTLALLGQRQDTLARLRRCGRVRSSTYFDVVRILDALDALTPTAEQPAA